ncbi:MAG: sulfatase [Gemmatimonadaceae bacterium]
MLLEPATPTARYTAVQLFTVTTACAVLSGVAEAAVGVYRHRIDHLPTGAFVAGEVFWMTPVAAVFSLGVVWLIWSAISAITPDRWRMVERGPVVAAGIATYGLCTAMSIGLADYAKLILAAAAALGLWRLMQWRPDAVVKGSRGVVITGAVALAGIAVLIPWRRAAAERSALAALPPAVPGAPNVVVLIWDTARAFNMSLYGYERRTTPVLDSLARHGVAFDRAFATAPWSLPSHASIFTGRYPHELSAGARIPLDATHPTIAGHFADHGYATAGITANLFYGSADYGIGRGFTIYDERPPIAPRVIGHTWIMLRRVLVRTRQAMGNHNTLLRRRATHVNQSFASWLDRREGRPFLAVLNYFDAHEPYLPPAPFDTAFASRGARYWADETLASAPAAVTRELHDVYDGAISYVDRSLGDLIDLLRTKGLLDNTILVVTSDHGEEFGERGPGLIGHNRSLYRHSLQVPLVVVYPPRIAAGVRSQAVVSIRDIPATIADLAMPNVGHPFPGTALARLLTDSTVADTADAMRVAMTEKHRWATRRQGWPTSWGSMYTVFDARAQYIVDALGKESLFDLAADQWNATDLAASAAYHEHVGTLRRGLDAYVGPPETRVPRFGARPSPPAAAADSH